MNELIKPVSPDEFTSIVTKLFVAILNMVQNFIKPISGLGVAIAILLLMIGYIFHIGSAKKLGASILAGTGFVFILYLLAPYILGVIYNTIK